MVVMKRRRKDQREKKKTQANEPSHIYLCSQT